MTATRAWFALSAVVLLVDQATKIAAHEWLAGRAAVVVVPGWFNLSYSRNPGGLFGFFRDLPDPWRLLLLTLVPLGAVAVIVSFLRRTDPRDRRSSLALALILGGAAGNLVDRLFRGQVIDFFDAYVSVPAAATWLVETFGTAHWPTFNVADSAIVVGALALASTVVVPPSLDSGPPAAPRPSE